MKKILIVEDDPCTRMIYCAGLQADGFATEDLGNGRAAIESLKSNPPDLVLLDLMLPEVSGLEVLKFLRGYDITKKLPVIVLSNSYERRMTDSARMAGANLCLCKSECNPRTLVREVRNLLPSTTPETTRRVTPATPVQAPAIMPSKATVDCPLTDEFGQRVRALRSALQNVGKSDEASRPARLLELRRAVHGIAGSAALAGLTRLARMSCALEALLNELHARPEKLNASSLRTVAQAIDFLISLVQNSGPQSNSSDAPRILVVDDEPISRQTICAALKKADLTATVLDNPLTALKLVEENSFDLVFLDVEMPGLNGFDLCRKLRAAPANATTPVVFVTTLNDFSARAQSNLSGGTDLIAKPVLLMELAVKTLIHLFRPRLTSAANPQQPAAVRHRLVEARLAA